MVDRKQRILAGLDLSGRGIEIGAGYNPTVRKADGYSVETVDHLPTHELIKKYDANPRVQTTAIESVDHVWRGEPLDRLIGNPGAYDWIIASHVIEHMPDPAGFFRQCEVLLKPGGVLSLAVPDKRYCFDYVRGLSTTGQIIQANIEGRTRHPPGVAFDDFAYRVTMSGATAWGPGHAGEIQMMAPIEEARRKLAQERVESGYVDHHAWTFTPSSFRLIVHDLMLLDFTRLKELRFDDTEGCEFYMALSMNGAGCPLDRRTLAINIGRELAAAEHDDRARRQPVSRPSRTWGNFWAFLTKRPFS